MRRFIDFFLSVIGIAFLFNADWRIAVGVVLIMLAHDVGSHTE